MIVYRYPFNLVDAIRKVHFAKRSVDNVKGFKVLNNATLLIEVDGSLTRAYNKLLRILKDERIFEEQKDLCRV